jgi:predicted lipoprotein with Yx(FWY)xxD motif
MMKTIAAAVAVLATATLMAGTADAAGYGSSSPPPMQMNQPPVHMKPGMMMMAPAHLMRTKKGLIWVDARGFALYTFSKDTPGMSTCYGKCAVAWPPFRAAMGARASGKWSIVHRMGFFGGQWAYNGKPLYFWFKDTRPGQVTGDGVNGFHVAR